MQMMFAASPIGLADKLVALGFLVRPLLNNEREALFVLTFDGQAVYLDVPDDLTPEQIAQIEQVVMSHTPSKS